MLTQWHILTRSNLGGKVPLRKRERHAGGVNDLENVVVIACGPLVNGETQPSAGLLRTLYPSH
jgi:hypothetical protein